MFPADQPAKQFVYIMWRPNQFKIGLSNQPRRRARELDAQLVFVMPGDRRLEREIHALFAAYRFPGTEWFGPGRPIWEWLDRHDVDLRRCA